MTKKSKTEDMAWDLNLVKDAVICLMLGFIIHNAFAAAVIIMESGHVVISALKAETIRKRSTGI